MGKEVNENYLRVVHTEMTNEHLKKYNKERRRSKKLDGSYVGYQQSRSYSCLYETH